MDADSEGMDNSYGVTINANALPPEQKLYYLLNPPNIKYNDEISNRRSVGWSNLIYGSRALHNFVKAYANVVNSMAYFVKTNPQTNVKKRDQTFPIQYQTSTSSLWSENRG